MKEFYRQQGDEIAAAFRAMSEERACRYHAAESFDEDLGRVARSTARKAADELGIGRPATVRWFWEFDDVTLSGVAFPYYGAIYLNTGLRTVDKVRFAAAHETAHLAGPAYDLEEAADGFAARFTGQQGHTPTASSDELKWLPSRASVSVNYWDLSIPRFDGHLD